MNSSYILSIVTFVYLASAFFYLATWVYKRPIIGFTARIVTIIGFICHTTGIIMRWVESYQMGIGHAPLSNLYESLVFFSWTIILIYLIIEYRYQNQIIGAFVTSLIISFIFIPFVANLVTFADDDEAIKTPPLCVSGIMFDEDNPLAVINGEVLGEGDTAGETRILKIKNSWVQFEYQGEVFNRELGEGCGKGVELPYRKDVKKHLRQLSE